MPSKAKQQLIVVNRKDGKTKGTIFFIKRTGYLDIWINGKRYYYNYVQNGVNPNNIDIDKVIRDIEAQEKKKKGVIVIKRK